MKNKERSEKELLRQEASLLGRIHQLNKNRMELADEIIHLNLEVMETQLEIEKRFTFKEQIGELANSKIEG